MKTLVPALSLAFFASVPAFAIDVTSCPLVIPAGEVGVVQSDFVCGGDESFSIVLERGARLELNGHTITADAGGGPIALVQCKAKCEIAGPGGLDAGIGGGGIWVESRARAFIHDITIDGFALAIAAPRADVRAVNVAMTATHGGIVTARRLELDNVQVTLPGDVGPCIEASNGGKVTGKDVTVTGCDYGVYSTRRMDLTNLTVTDSRIGVFSTGRVLLTDSAVTGSEHYDIYSGGRPILVNTTCDVSQKYNRARFGPDGSWNACPGE
jgi:hypothetical protein